VRRDGAPERKSSYISSPVRIDFHYNLRGAVNICSRPWMRLHKPSNCYCLSVTLASEFGRIVVLPHPDGLDEINSDRADARGSTVSGSGILLYRGQQLISSSYYRHLASLSEQNQRSPPWQIWEISPSCSEFSDLHPSPALQAHGRGRSRDDVVGEDSRTPTGGDFGR